MHKSDSWTYMDDIDLSYNASFFKISSGGENTHILKPDERQIDKAKESLKTILASEIDALIET